MELRLLHHRIGAPAEIADELRPRIGAEFLITNDQLQLHEAFEHFWRAAPDRLQEHVTGVAALTHQSGAAVVTNRDFRNGMAAARIAQGWHADVVVAAGVGPWLLHAWTCAELLDLPLVVVLDDRHEESVFRALLPELCGRARVVVTDGVASEAVPAGVAAVAAVDARAVRAAIRGCLGGERAAAAPVLGFPAAYVGHEVESAARAADEPRAFVVLGDERTGTTMLVDLLRGQDGVWCADEIFNPRQICEGRISWPGASDAEREQLVRWRSAAPARVLTELRRSAAKAGARWAGFKLLYSHGTADGRVLQPLVMDREFFVVDMRRRNRLRRWVSFCRATASDAWYSRGTPQPVAGAVTIDPESMLRSFVLGELLEARYRALFGAHRYLQLTYEDVVDDLAAAVRQLGDHFGDDCGERFAVVAPRSRKTGSGGLRDAIANHDEVAATLRRTRWQALLEEPS